MEEEVEGLASSNVAFCGWRLAAFTVIRTHSPHSSRRRPPSSVRLSVSQSAAAVAAPACQLGALTSSPSLFIEATIYLPLGLAGFHATICSPPYREDRLSEAGPAYHARKEREGERQRTQERRERQRSGRPCPTDRRPLGAPAPLCTRRSSTPVGQKYTKI